MKKEEGSDGRGKSPVKQILYIVDAEGDPVTP